VAHIEEVTMAGEKRSAATEEQETEAERGRMAVRACIELVKAMPPELPPYDPLDPFIAVDMDRLRAAHELAMAALRPPRG
jgi:hypothetical protein